MRETDAPDAIRQILSTIEWSDSPNKIRSDKRKKRLLEEANNDKKN